MSSDQDRRRRGADEKQTIPPPAAVYTPDEADEADERTLLTNVPEELIAESLREPPPKAVDGGLRQMFSRDPSKIRDVLPTEAEGDALLDMLFQDAQESAAPEREPIPDEDTIVGAPPAPVGSPAAAPAGPPRPAAPKKLGAQTRGALAPPLPPRPATPAATPAVRPPPPPRSEMATLDPEALEAGAGEERAEEVDLSEVSFAPPEVAEPEAAASAPIEDSETIPLSVPLPSRAPRDVSLSAERDATVVLVESGQRDAWLARAAWLRAEAEALEERGARARALLVVSELFAMAGEDETARAIAREVRELAPSSPLAHRQLRALAARVGDRAAEHEALEIETKVVPTPAARCHGALLASTYARLVREDREAAARGLDHATRAAPTDPRAAIQRIADHLAAFHAGRGDAAALAKVRVPESAELAPLAAAAQALAARRGPEPHKAPRPPVGVADAFARARAALAAKDIAFTTAHLETVARAAPLSAAAGWLTAALAAPHADTRPRATNALRHALDGSHAELARRALAARAIETGDGEAARTAVETAAPGAFTAADKIAIAALTGASGPTVDGWIEAAGSDPELAPLMSAASAALGDVAFTDRRVVGVGEPKSRAATSLARALASAAVVPPEGSQSLLSDETLVNAVQTYADLSQDAVARALALELDVSAGAAVRVARAIGSWDAGGAGSARDRALASALIFEIAGDNEQAGAELHRASLADPTHEGAARARASLVDPTMAARILAEHAAALEPGPRAAALFCEAAVGLERTDALEEAEALLRKAVEADPKQSLAVHLGERLARGRGDRDALVEWLRRRREASDDAIEQAHDLVREALLLSDAEGSPAALLLEQALRARPKDVGLRELFERLAGETPADYASWRIERAAELPPTDAARLSLEAALEYERAGDFERAAAAARIAIAAGENLLAPICAYRCALAGHGAGDLIDSLLTRARETPDAAERLEIYERMADLDELGRGDAASGLLWRRTILEETPGHLPTLRKIARALIAGGRDVELEPIALEIAKALPGPEGAAHALVSARLRLRAVGWDETREPIRIAYQSEPRGIYALRQTAAHARVKGEHALAVEADQQLLERTDRPAEVATLALRAAEDAIKANMTDAARELLERAAAAVPEHLVVREELARVLEASGDLAGAAYAYEGVAAAAQVPEHRLAALYQAARIWLDGLKDSARARVALERIVEVDPAYQDTAARLQSIYVAEGARAELADLLRRRLEAVTDPKERVEMEVLRGRALAEVGETAAAKFALAAALDQSPDHVDALSAFADLCAAEEDWSGAEQAWIRLVRLVPDPAKQAAIYLKLGDLYDGPLPNPERAELAYREILKRSQDESARERLVRLYRKAGDAARAVEEQTVLITNAQEPEAKCRRTCELADIYEGAGDLKKAEATLLNARKTWPKDEVALGALVRFYQRTGQQPAAQVLLDRAVADARRALATGRFEPYLFTTIASVAELRGRPDAARVAAATVAALDGTPVELTGAGNQAGDPRLDDLLAPDVMTPAFRELCLKTGPLLDAAVPFDLTSIRATPLPPPMAELAENVRVMALAYGLPGVHVQVSAALGPVCVAASAHPPTIVLGQPLLATPRADVRLFLIHRALKVIQSNTAAFARTAPIDLWPLLAAYLKAFAPSWTPVGVDAAKMTDAYARISRVLPSLRVDPQVGVLAADVIGSIGNRASTLNVAVNGWGDRAGLLALGDPSVAITGIAWAGGHLNAPPASGKERITWIGRNAEARELVVFSVSDAYADARSRLGLGR